MFQHGQNWSKRFLQRTIRLYVETRIFSYNVFWKRTINCKQAILMPVIQQNNEIKGHRHKH